jgi:predicted Zn finger-like uncharacterized protein
VFLGTIAARERGVKFLCDKCKTRYSIGDERVRGKILKIRCKNCANVITVREGMDIAPSEPRRNPTMAIQAVQVAEAAPQGQAARSQGALGAAFASQLAKPPPALEEEWYVSIDGNQAGPFSLSRAQRWVASKPFEAELHCWSEGFDDWLPVDKVSHFRNLRKRAEPRRTPTMPPPIPKIAPRAAEPKPLFAATMASIEKSAGVAPEPSGHAGLPPRTGVQPPIATKANGAGVAQTFKDTPDAATQIDSPAFTSDDIATTAEPIAAKRVEAKVPALGPPPDDDDNLEIGEVSRVVNLSDLASMGRPRTQSNSAVRGPQGNAATASSPALRTSSTNLGVRGSGLTGSHQRLSPSELGMNVDPSLAAVAAPGAPTADESIVARSFAQRHRRGMMLLIGVSGMLVLGVVAAVAFFVSTDDADLPIGLGGTRVIDTSRPEDIVRRQLPPAPNTTTGPTAGQKPRVTTQRPQTTVLPELPADPTGPNSKLDAVEIETMAAKQGEGTKRCYMRAQKGALGFEIADTKKIDVTLTVARDGSVSSVQLSKHANNEFGQCLIARIKAWKFRESRGGTFRIALAFSAG